MILVKATREGLNGLKTSSGVLITPDLPFVALPSGAALHLWIRLYSPTTKKSCRALVLDTGPWNTSDHAYVFQPATTDHTGMNEEPAGAVRPAAERGISVSMKGTNSAGIDLSEKVRALLALPASSDNETVGWEFD